MATHAAFMPGVKTEALSLHLFQTRTSHQSFTDED